MTMASMPLFLLSAGLAHDVIFFEAIANLSRLLSAVGSEMVHDGRLCKALRELKEYRKGGKQPPRRLYLAVG